MSIKISIITATYNSEKTISATIDSVLSQNYKNVEYIIIDGASSDRTMDIVRSYGSLISKVISEPDRGIYDAMNKGIKIATGDVIGILNSDDLYNNEQVLNEIVGVFERDDVEAVYGDLVYVDENDIGKVIRTWRSGIFKPGSFALGWHPPHPALFIKREIYEKYGAFDLNFEISADFELMLRLFEKYMIKPAYIPKILVRMRLGGASNKSLKNIIKGNINCYRAFIKNNIKVSVLYPLFRLLPKIRQFFHLV